MFIWKINNKKEVKFIVQEIRWEQIMKCDLFNQGFLEISNVVKRD